MNLLHFLGSLWNRISGRVPENKADDEVQFRKMANRNRRMMRRALDANGLKYDFDKDNECFVVGFQSDDAENVSFLLLIHSGINSYRAEAIGSRVEDLKLKDAILFCNKWNSENPFPRAYVAPGTNHISGDMFLTLGLGADNEYVQKFILRHFLTENCSFFNAAGQYDFIKSSAAPASASAE